MFPGPLGFSLAGRALEKEIYSLNIINIRDFGITKHRNVDDTQAGGGSGLVMRPDVLGDALDHALEETIKSNPKKEKSQIPILYPSPRGKKFDQSIAKSLSKIHDMIILCGRFEGIDERVIEEYNIQEISMGDYILSGGEIAAYAMIDAILRLVPGVIANSDTLKEESFEEIYTKDHIDNSSKTPQDTPPNKTRKLLEYPLYTKPSIWRKRAVPEVLLSGNHREIEKWKYKKSLELTKRLRPDLL